MQGSLGYLQSHSTSLYSSQEHLLPFADDETRHQTLALIDLQLDITQNFLNFLRFHRNTDFISRLGLEEKLKVNEQQV
jgi:hypothetical protein